MNIGVLAPVADPPVFGGLDRALEGLVHAFNDRSAHQAELVRVTVNERTLSGLVAGYRSFAELDASRFDLVITSKYPAWLVRHPEHVVFLFHRLRGLYDTYHAFGLSTRVDHDDPMLARLQRLMRGKAERAALPEFFDLFEALVDERGADDAAFPLPGPFAREVVHFLDQIGMDPHAIRRFFALSKTVAARPEYFPPGVGVEVVYTPSDLAGVRTGAFRHFFTVSRLDAPKRIDLIVEAMRFVSHDIPLKIAGTGPELERLRVLAAGDARITFLGRVDDDALVELYAESLAVPFVPADEDLGLVALEAMSSAKAVVTCSDSGGPTEFVVDSTNGLVVDPSAKSLGAALERLASAPDLAASLGAAAQETAERLTWERTIRALLVPPQRRPRVPKRKPRSKVVLLATFPIAPAAHGGQLRLLHLCRGLAERHDVEVVSLVNEQERPRDEMIAPGIRQVVVPKTTEHAYGEAQISDAVGWLPVSDLAATHLISLTPEYLAAVRSSAASAGAVVLSHPYLLPAWEAAAPRLPLVYEAQDVETDLKRAVLPDTQAGASLLAGVESVEAAAVRAAALTTACSADDAATLAGRSGVSRERLLVIENGVDLRTTPFADLLTRRHARDRWLRAFDHDSPSTAAITRLAVFFGSWHPPNIDAANAIVETAAERPETRYVLAGGHCSSFEQRVLPPNVTLAGVVSNLSKRILLTSADVGVNPMRLGSGTNLKVVEYLAARLPVVTTSIGARGLPLDDPPFVIAEVDEFPFALGTVFGDPRATADRAWRGRELVERDYDWSVLSATFAAAVSRVVSDGT